MTTEQSRSANDVDRALSLLNSDQKLALLDALAVEATRLSPHWKPEIWELTPEGDKPLPCLALGRALQKVSNDPEVQVIAEWLKLRAVDAIERGSDVL